MGSAEVARAPPCLTTGWGQVSVLSLTEVTSWGILYYAFPVFLQPMQRSLGWSVPALTGAYSLALLCSALAAIPVGRWLDRHRNPRMVMTLGSLFGTAGTGRRPHRRESLARRVSTLCHRLRGAERVFCPGGGRVARRRFLSTEAWR